jgi:predicted fused transcriptional regulator/phosphomethylpyrimidine kinase
MEAELVAKRIIKEAIDISMGCLRYTIRDNMDENAMVNGFALMVALKDLEKQLSVIVDNGNYDGKEPA